MDYGNENNSVKGEESTTATITENTTGNKNESCLVSSNSSTLSSEGIVFKEDSISAKSFENGTSDGTSNTSSNSTSITANNTNDATVSSSPIEVSKAGGTTASKSIAADKVISEREGVGITNKTGKSTTVGDTTTATLAKTDHSSTRSTASKTKIDPTTGIDVEKLKAETSVGIHNSEGSQASTITKTLRKEARKKRKTLGTDEVLEKDLVIPKKKKPKRKKENEDAEKQSTKNEISKKIRKQTKKASDGSGNSGGRSYADLLRTPAGLSAAQTAVQEQMRKALQEDQYSANGSIVDTDSDDDEHQYMYKGRSVRLDRVYLLQAAKKCAWLHDLSNERLLASPSGKVPTISKNGETNDPDVGDEEGILNNDVCANNSGHSSKKKSSRCKKKGRNQYTNRRNNSNSSKGKNTNFFKIDKQPDKASMESDKAKKLSFSGSSEKGAELERDEGSIFGQTTGSSNSTWVECDKCKKWRRLRGVVDHSKLPKKWYCSMNRNDPERARCSAPEEEYDAPHTAESAADARTRRHLRVWVRRLQCNEQYESRLSALTQGKKHTVASSSKEPYEWVRCCNPSCGKWRVILKIMDAKRNVVDRTTDGEWYCVMNTWDEKVASCAAPQENLPAIGCPPWVLQDEN